MTTTRAQVELYTIDIDGIGTRFDMSAAAQEVIDRASAYGLRNGTREIVRVRGLVNAKLKARRNVDIIGVGRPTIRLPNGVGGSVISHDDFADLDGTSSTAAVAAAIQNFGLKNLLIDGNKANQVAGGANEGHGVAIYGRNFDIQDLYITDTFRDGLKLSYATGTHGISPFNGRVDGVTTDKAGGNGIVMDVSDTHMDNLNVRSPSQLADNTYDAIVIKAAVHMGARCNVWRGGSDPAAHRYSIYIMEDADTTRIAGAVLETAKTANFRCDADSVQAVIRSYNCLGLLHAILDGHLNTIDLSYFKGGIGAAGQSGLKLGDTKAARNNHLRLTGSGAPLGGVNIGNDGGGNVIHSTQFLDPSDVLFTGALNPLDDVTMIGQALLTADRRTYRKPAADDNTLTAFGTDSNTLTRIRRSFTRIKANDGTGTNGAKFDQPYGGEEFWVLNVGAVPVWIYPHAAGSFRGLSANVGVQLPVNALWGFRYAGTGAEGGWAVIKSA